MAISVSVLKRTGITPVGRTVVANVTFDSTYPAGGEPYTPAMFGLNSIDHLQCEVGLASSTTAMVALANHATSKLMLFNSNGAAPAALLETSTVDQSATVVRVVAYEMPFV